MPPNRFQQVVLDRLLEIAQREGRPLTYREAAARCSYPDGRPLPPSVFRYHVYEPKPGRHITKAPFRRAVAEGLGIPLQVLDEAAAEVAGFGASEPAANVSLSEGPGGRVVERVEAADLLTYISLWGQGVDPHDPKAIAAAQAARAMLDSLVHEIEGDS